MKLAFCIFTIFPYGGLQRDCLRVIKAAIARGHEVHLFTRSFTGERPDKLHVHLITTTARSNHKKNQQFFEKISSELSQFDCVIGFNRMPSLDIYFAGDKCFKQQARDNHGKWFTLTPRYKTYAKFEEAAYGQSSSTHILLLTELEKKVIQNHYQTPNERFTVLPPGIEPDRIPQNPRIAETIRERHHLKATDILCLAIGSHFKRKGVDRSLIALASLPKALQKRVKFYVIGDDDPPQHLIKKLKLEQQVTFLGGRQDAADYLLACQVFLHPAREEAAGMVLIEALVAEKPILTTACCGYAPLIAEAKAGIVLPSPFSQSEYNQALLSLLEKDRAQFEKNCRQYKETHHLFGLVDEFITIIEKQ